jgi:hypothetical protein
MKKTAVAGMARAKQFAPNVRMSSGLHEAPAMIFRILNCRSNLFVRMFWRHILFKGYQLVKVLEN